MTGITLPDSDAVRDEEIIDRLVADLRVRDYSILPGALPENLASALLEQVRQSSENSFRRAGIGRRQDHALNRFVRRDRIRWIEGQSPAEQQWLAWCGRLQASLNRHLLLGLFAFESHFAHYAPGTFYKKHLDAFRPDELQGNIRSGQSNRVLSIVAYLNPGWRPDDGGQLLIYGREGADPLLGVTPAFGTVVAFLSEEVPHEVLPAQRHRYSIAGWFRVQGEPLLPLRGPGLPAAAEGAID